MIVNKCATCPLLFVSKRHRSYCSRECHRLAVEHDVADRLAEFHWIAGTDTWDNIARRLGFGGIKYLARWLWRVGERDYARQVERYEASQAHMQAA